MGGTTEKSGVDSQEEKGNFIFSKTFRTDVWPTQPPMQWVPGDLDPELSGQNVRMTTVFFLPRL